MCLKVLKHFPSTIITLLRIQGFWPSGDGYVTILHALQVCMFYCLSSFWLYLGCCIHLFTYYNNPKVDIADSIVVILEGLFFYYSFSLYFMKVNNIIEFVRDLENFHKFGEPKHLQTFKREHNIIVKLMCGYCAICLIIYSIISSLDKQTCEERNRQTHKNYVCGLLVAVWTPINISNNGRYVILTLETLTYSIALLSAITVSYFIITSFDMIVIKTKHMNNILKSIPTLTKKMQKEKIIRCIKYHIHIIRLTKKCNNCFGDISAVHFNLSSLILGILNYQAMKELDPREGLHLLGWLFILYLLCNAGQNVINESLLTSRTLYFLNWYDYDSDLKFDIRIMMMRAQQPLSVKAGIFYSYSFELLLAILKASFTYMTVMANLQSYQ